MSSNQPHPSLSLHPTDRWLGLGPADAVSPRMQGDMWVVFHAREGWTHLYRVDRREPRLVHLVRCEEGDRRASLAAWAGRAAKEPAAVKPAGEDRGAPTAAPARRAA